MVIINYKVYAIRITVVGAFVIVKINIINYLCQEFTNNKFKVEQEFINFDKLFHNSMLILNIVIKDVAKVLTLFDSLILKTFIIISC